MSEFNPSVKASDLISDVENRLGNPNISATIYYPWVSYAYLKTWAALVNAGQTVKEKLFGNYLAVPLTNGIAEYTLSTILPRFSSHVKFEILYGGTGDQRVRLPKLRSISQWNIQGNVSTSYRSKGTPVCYILQDKLGIIPTPPLTDSGTPTLYAWYVKGPFKITDGDDSVDIPYRFIYPLVNYIQAKAMQKENEDYGTSAQLESIFKSELEEIAEAADSEFNENEGMGIEVDSDSPLYDNPLRS